MTAKSSPVKFTCEDYILFPDDGRRHEVIDGEHYVTLSPNTRHQRICSKLVICLGGFVDNGKLGQVFTSPIDVVLSDVDVVQPDVLFVSSIRALIITESNIQRAPDLVIEILSPGTRRTDEVIKRKLYERSGVDEYWIVDPELETVKVYRLTDGKFERTAELFKENSDILTTPLLPSLQIPLTYLFD